MRPHSRIRRITKWTGVGIFLLILAAWGLSLRWIVVYLHPVGWKWGAWIQNGTLGLMWGVFMTDNETGWQTRNANVLDGSAGSLGFVWPVHTSMGYGGSFHTAILPFWCLLAIVSLLMLSWYYLGRQRIPPGHCAKCGYDLTGNVSGVCPECGTPKTPFLTPPGPFSAGGGSSPAGSGPSPAGGKPSPAGSGPFPAGGEPSPAGSGPAPTGGRAFPAGGASSAAAGERPAAGGD